MPHARLAISMYFRSFVFLAFAGIFCWGPLASATTLYVDIANTSGVETRASWESAFVSIQDAIDAAAMNDTVSVRPGTYTESLVVPYNMHILSTDINSPEDYIIDGGAQSSVIRFVNTIGYHNSESKPAGFTIQNGLNLNGAGICGGRSAQRITRTRIPGSHPPQHHSVQRCKRLVWA
ncbi:MAG: hypothetical protein K1Y02_20380 [Candidatus Hydrogenedentes bacterium]|nr:hypothetical protein [Candidatus Hydrogenedentota bacterium]